MNNQISRQELMRTIMEYDFAMYDLALYLDTHPKDEKSLAIFKQLKHHSDKHTEEYVRLYGPIRFDQVTSDDYWTWVSESWPWEGGCM